jgi:squalene-hopene/tetraprenyl-beta-curcumene cyclase
VDRRRLEAALEKVTKLLLTEMNPAGHWTGELSSSALSTAVAVIALDRMGEKDFTLPGLRWLAEHANADGGWGDTVRSQSNLSTTALVWAAFGATNQDAQFVSVVQRAEAWLWKAAGSRERLPEAIIARYGKDRTFSIPILMTLALSGRLGKEGWREVLPLPFELAALPQSWFAALQLPVVSYALPALIAIGQTIHHHAPSKNPVARAVRELVKARTLRRLERLQPVNGGFLEATPLTSFVTMSLASMGLQQNVVAARGASFLKSSMRADGSWPIDTNLATWLTTLAVKALVFQRGEVGRVAPRAPSVSDDERRDVTRWLLAQQYRTTHPYTGAAPGGWAWTDLPGGVPDADDTAGALIALSLLAEPNDETIRAAEKGVKWLLDLQNRDGGIPTFCRGWGTLPFDRSAAELTVHAMEAWMRWRPHVSPELARRIDRSMRSAEEYLIASQRADGAWIPLWFGNENASEQENAVYGTARTLAGLNELIGSGVRLNLEILTKADGFLRRTQLASGGWGGGAGTLESLEETALAAEALNDARGINRVIELVEADQFTPTPIGLYFARLWYFEELYPLIFAASALGRAASKKL